MYASLGQIPFPFDTNAISKALVDQAVNHLKPRLPELVNSAVPPAIEALKKNAPAIINAVAPALETYATQRFYPQIVRPLIDKEIANVQSAAKQTTRTAGLVAGGVTVAILALILTARKSRPS